MKTTIQKIISPITMYNKETGEKIMELPVTDNIYAEVPMETSFNTKFPTWIIAYCPDTDSFYVTNERFWFWEYDKEFETENDGIRFFEDNIKLFCGIENTIMNKMVYKWKNVNSVFLENTGTWYLDI